MYDQAVMYDTTVGAAAGTYLVLVLIISIINIIAMWRIFSKAGEPGWASIVPIYNLYVLFKIAFGSGWMFLLCLVPFVNVIISIVLVFKLAKAFGHGIGFGFGLWLLNPIFMIILAFGSSEYQY